jgi:alanine racemase
MYHTSSLEISASAYSQNIAFIRSRIGPKPVISAVVKGNGYGHGIAQLVPIAENAGVNHFSTFSTDEAEEVLNSSTLPIEIMIMGMLHQKEISELIQLGIQFFVFDFERLEKAIEAAKSLRKKAQIHVEIETGFRRADFERVDCEKLLKLLQDNHSNLEFKGLCPHFAGAESTENQT